MRMFVALRAEDPLKRAAVQYMEELKRLGVSGSFTKPDNLHITLAFIGESAYSKRAEQAIRNVRSGPFVLESALAGRFGDILWLGFKKSGCLSDLAEGVRAELTKAGFSLDNRPFKAHMTLARRVRLPEGCMLKMPPVQMQVKEICLMKSELGEKGLVYTPLYKKKLE